MTIKFILFDGHKYDIELLAKHSVYFEAMDHFSSSEEYDISHRGESMRAILNLLAYNFQPLKLSSPEIAYDILQLMDELCVDDSLRDSMEKRIVDKFDKKVSHIIQAINMISLINKAISIKLDYNLDIETNKEIFDAQIVQNAFNNKIFDEPNRDFEIVRKGLKSKDWINYYPKITLKSVPDTYGSYRLIWF